MAGFCLRLLALTLLSAAALPAASGTSWAQTAATRQLCKEDRTEKGLAACTAMLKGKPKPEVRAFAHLGRAQVLIALGRPAEALKDYDETIKLAPNFVALYRDRGRARYAVGDHGGAMADFSVAVEREPFAADNHANRAYLKIVLDDLDGARKDIDQGLFWEKEHARSYYLRGLLLYRLGQYGDAITAINRGRELGFRTHDGFITKALSHYRLGAFDAAETEASEGLKAFANQPDLLEARARTRLELKRPAEALADADEVVRLAPRYARAYSTRAAVKLALNDNNGARADADKAVELDPKLFDAQQVKAEILMAAGDRDGARAIYQRSAARTDARTAQDIASRDRAAARIIQMDAPKPIVVSELDEAELKKRCETRDDPLRLQSCDRLVETAATPEAKADWLIERSYARPFGQRLADLEEAVAAAPGYSPALLGRAKGHSSEYRYDEDLRPLDLAWADADSALRLAAGNAGQAKRARVTRAVVAFTKGDYERASADLTAIMALDDDMKPWAYDLRAQALLYSGKPAEALVDARQAKALMKPESAGLFREDALVISLIETGQIDAALTEIDAWKARDPRAAIGHGPLYARALLARGDAAAAYEAANALVAANQFNMAAIAVRGAASARLGRALDASGDISNVLDASLKIAAKAQNDNLTPNFAADLLVARGLARIQLNQMIAARADFGEAIRLAPDRAQAYGERAGLTYRAGDPAALADIAMALRIEPAAPRWLALAARVNLATKDPTAAEKFASEALAANAPDADLPLLRARARLATGNLKGAVEDATMRTTAAPGDAEAWLVRIEAQAGLGDLTAALADAEAARAANASDGRILLALGDLKARSGDAPAAIGVFEEAASKPDAALAANKRLGDLYAGIASDQLALGYYAKALELPLRKPEDEALKAAARAARDALIRKMSAK
ncbi:tetratricopeptide repeat protein [Bosea caraganae]|uniref:Tetratricopeptide repeat protein n=1 Tax=Bosea caraganae TaxID=2763117 RepID=A0A370L737_9HYPH|nr:tetratricopeptide repeat protein [Bosea caraganae]RDJ24877.1 tetratricopeptide repeat protein [Bosea caraganae]RDJ25989.1 tetratricopeptide repeat protein [Bosea caraganae]